MRLHDPVRRLACLQIGGECLCALPTRPAGLEPGFGVGPEKNAHRGKEGVGHDSPDRRRRVKPAGKSHPAHERSGQGDVTLLEAGLVAGPAASPADRTAQVRAWPTETRSDREFAVCRQAAAPMRGREK